MEKLGAGLRKYARFAQTLPFPDSDLFKMVGGKAKVLSYPEIQKYPTLDAMLHPHDACVVLYLQKPHYGHWCVFMRQHDGKGNEWVEFFDPYGKPMDTQLKDVDPSFLLSSGQNTHWLTELVEDSPYADKLVYNAYPLQHRENSVSTCGRWCALRVGLRQWPLDQFINVFKGKDSDLMATCWTSARLAPFATHELVQMTKKQSGGKRRRRK